MYKIISLFIALFVSFSSVKAESITKTIHSLNINPAAISVSIKNVKDGSELYSLNSKTPMNPASTLKLLTAACAYDLLGPDFLLSTRLYKSTNNDLYLKLVGDPLLKTEDLETLFKTAHDKNILEPKKIYIDDSIFDSVEWGEGWQWDDDLNPLMPKFSAYNLDGNILNIEITPSQQEHAPIIYVKPFYPVTVMNLLSTDLKSANDIKIQRNNSIAPNIINVSGIISKKYVAKIPVNDQKLYFKLRLADSIKKENIDYYSAFETAKLPSKEVYPVEKIENHIEDILKIILKDSSNHAAESLFKLAGATWAQAQGTNDNSVKMLNEFITKLDLNSEEIKVVDGSGVSKNNLMNADFMTDFLVKIYQDKKYDYFRSIIPIAGEGTLKNRMLYFNQNLQAKTGTLSDISAIAGYITTRKGKTYAFDIMIKDGKTSTSDKKNIEEQILRQIYMN